MPLDRPDPLVRAGAQLDRVRQTCRGRGRTTALLVTAFVAPWLWLFLLLAFGGCASSGGGVATTTSLDGEDRPALAVANPASYNSPLARSAVRERALKALMEAATSDVALLRANAIEALAFAPARIESVARMGLHDPNVGVRFAAAMTVGELQLRSLRDLIRPLLRDEDPAVRAAAIYALDRCGERVDPTPIATLLQSDDPRERANAVYILGEMDNSSAIPMLKSVAADPMPMASLAEVRLLRLQVAEALVKLGDSTAVETLRAALFPARPEDLEAAALAVQIIGEVRDRRSLDQLIYLTELDNEERLPAEVRLGAAASAAKLGERGGAFIADEYWRDANPAIRAQAAYVYGLIGGSVSLAMLDAMLGGDPNDLVSVSAAAGVLRITSGSGADPGRAAADRAGG